MRRFLLAAALSAAVAPVSATSLSSTITFASDYLFDGVSQTQGADDRYFNPALQVSLDLAWDNGFYIGTWASNVDFGVYEDDDGMLVEDPASTEVDLYGGYAWETAGGLGLDVGLAHYTYVSAPTEGYDYTEAYFGVTFANGAGLKGFVANDDDVLGGFAWRVKGTQSFALSDVYSLDLEGTYTDYEDADGFLHAQLGVSREAGPFSLYLGYSKTDIHDDPTAAGRFLFTASTTVDLF